MHGNKIYLLDICGTSVKLDSLDDTKHLIRLNPYATSGYRRTAQDIPCAFCEGVLRHAGRYEVESPRAASVARAGSTCPSLVWTNAVWWQRYMATNRFSKCLQLPSKKQELENSWGMAKVHSEQTLRFLGQSNLSLKWSNANPTSYSKYIWWVLGGWCQKNRFWVPKKRFRFETRTQPVTNPYFTRINPYFWPQKPGFPWKTWFFQTRTKPILNPYP